MTKFKVKFGPNKPRFLTLKKQFMLTRSQKLRDFVDNEGGHVFREQGS